MNNSENQVKAEQKKLDKATGDQPEQVVTKEKKSGWGIKIGIGVISATIVIAVISFFAVGGLERQRLEEYLSLGNRYLEEMKYEQAIAAFENAISIDPKNEDAYLGLAETYFRFGDHESSIETLDEGISEFEELGNGKGDRAIERLEEYREDIVEDWEDLKASQRQLQEDLLNRIEELSDNAQNEDNEIVDASETGNANETEAEEEPQGPFAGIHTDSIVTFGTYEQDNNLENGPESIQWYVLDVADGKALLLSVYILDCKPYHDNNTNVTWENCTLRSWLNDEFYNTAFGDDDKSYIILSNIENNEESYSETGVVNSTVDNIFLLCNEELQPYVDATWINTSGVHAYLNAAPTSYALANGVYEFPDNPYEDMEIYWKPHGGRLWSRTSGYALDVWYEYGGSCGLESIPVNDSETGVRPAMWVDIT